MWTALLIAADLSGALTLSDRTEVRFRAPGTVTTAMTRAASLDLETTPEARLTLASRRSRYTFTYAPRLTLWDVSTGAQPTLLHAGAVRVEWHSHLTRLSLEQAGSYGGMSFAYVSLQPGPGGAPPRVDVVPTPQILQYGSSTTTLASRLALRRWTLTTSAGYRLSGGTDAASRALLPFQSGPFGEAAADHAITRRDHVVTTVSASEAAFSSGPESVVVEVNEGYRHLWTRTLETRLTLGVSEVRVRAGASASYVFETYPVAEIVLDEHPRTAEGHLAVRFGARLGPVVNQLLGIVDERVQGTLAVGYAYRRLATHAFAVASQSVPTSRPYATTLLSGELGAAYGVSRVVSFDVGVRALWQRADVTRAAFLQGTAFIGVTLRAPPIRL